MRGIFIAYLAVIALGLVFLLVVGALHR